MDFNSTSFSTQHHFYIFYPTEKQNHIIAKISQSAHGYKRCNKVSVNTLKIFFYEKFSEFRFMAVRKRSDDMLREEARDRLETEQFSQSTGEQFSQSTGEQFSQATDQFTQQEMTQNSNRFSQISSIQQQESETPNPKDNRKRGRPKKKDKEEEFDWSDDAIETLIDHWQERDVLYDVNHPKYHLKDITEQAESMHR